MAAEQGTTDPQLEQLLEEHKRYFERTDAGKIRCLCNGHEFPARYDVLAPFLKGSKFATIRKRYDAEHSLEKYEPFIVQSKNFPNMLYCALTGQLMDKSMPAVQKHMKGKRFQRYKDLFAADKKELKPEPDIDTLMAEIMGRKASTAAAKDHNDSGAEDNEAEGDDEQDSDVMDASDGDDEDMEAADSDGEEEDQDMEMAVQQAKQKPKSNKTKAGNEPAKGKSTEKAANKKAPTVVVGAKRGREKPGKLQPGQETAVDAAASSSKAKKGKQSVGVNKPVKVRGEVRKQAQDNVAAKGAKADDKLERTEGADGDEGPEFWVPEEFADLELAASDASDEETMPENAVPSKATVKKAAAASAKGQAKQKKAGGANHVKSSKQINGKEERQLAEARKPKNAASENGNSATGSTPKPKRNANKPSKAKKARS